MPTPLPLQALNTCSPRPDLISCGFPTPDDLALARDAGFKTVVNMCQVYETPASHIDKVQALGMDYVSLPVGGPPDLTPEKARALASIIDDPARLPALLHCMSGNRVGALLAMKACYADNASPEEALAFGLAGGLKALEPEVRRLLAEADSQRS